jgi:glucose/arabinose dehydrogenase
VIAAVLAAVALTPFASGFDEPVHLAAAPGEKGRLYVVEQAGVIKVLVGRRIRARPFLNIISKVSSGGERGLLSVAFHPRYAKNRRFFVYYTDTNGDTRVVAYRSNGTVALPSSARVIFAEKQPYPNHNGGQLVFGPDGLLYIGLGDGGSGGDPDNNGQTLRTKLAKIWKLNVDRPGAKPQLVAYGLRNPWRFSFDRANGDLYIADVGQGEWEEIDYVARADRGLKNFGWAAYEGNARYDSRALLPGGKLTPPIAVYSHDEGCSVTGGFVYRGREQPNLRGRYYYGDYCSGNVWSLRVQGGKAVDLRREDFQVPGLTSFGEDNAGGLYAVSHSGRIFKVAG